MTRPFSFAYDATVLEQFPTIRAGVIHAVNLGGGPSPPALIEEFRREQTRTLSKIGDTPLSEIPSLGAWRRVFSGFGVKPTQYRNAAESLLRRLTKQGDIPSINLLVDLGNLVSIRYALPVAFFDTSGIAGSTKVAFARGDETFTDLGSEQTTHPDPGEVIFVDEGGVVSARRWCWRQSAQTATSEATTEALVTIEGHHDAAEADVAAALDDLVDLLDRYQPGADTRSGTLSPAAPSFP